MAMSADGDRQSEAEAREALSSLMDGELDRPRVAAACEQWRQSAAARDSWHAYHVIGDALRSDDLAAEPSRDRAFLQALRARLADEPVVLAPEPLDVAAPVGHLTSAASPGPRGTVRHRSWLAGSAIAAGFVAVAGVLVVTRAPIPADERVAAAAPSRVAAPLTAPVVVVATAPTTAPTTVSTSSPTSSPTLNSAASTPTHLDPSEPQAYVANPQLIRSARLDRYLSAHQQFAGSSALGMPSGFMRHATADAAAR